MSGMVWLALVMLSAEFYWKIMRRTPSRFRFTLFHEVLCFADANKYRSESRCFAAANCAQLLSGTTLSKNMGGYLALIPNGSLWPLLWTGDLLC
jgi:hypothetical protein